MTDSAHYLVTGEPAELLLGLGQQPVSHHYCVPNQADGVTVPVRLGQGIETGLVGLLDRIDWQMIAPKFDWVVCNEPEDHLDDVTQHLIELLPSKAVQACALSGKDDTLLARLQRQGAVAASVAVHPQIQRVEQAQAQLEQILPNEPVSLILARHILEHTQNTVQFLQRLRTSLADDGILLLELPDNEKAFNSHLHTIIWEEHSLYFTQASLNNLLIAQGFEVVWQQRYTMALEDILVVAVKKTDSLVKPVSHSEATMKPFAESFITRKQAIQQALKERRKQGPIGMLGAGHFGAAFVNFYQLGELIDYVLDDDPNKQGLLLPGAKLPIVSGKVMYERGLSTCLLTCNPWNNEKIAANHAKFTSGGGQFWSVFTPEEWI